LHSPSAPQQPRQIEAEHFGLGVVLPHEAAMAPTASAAKKAKAS
jgi:hypothetical protein